MNQVHYVWRLTKFLILMPWIQVFATLAYENIRLSSLFAAWEMSFRMLSLSLCNCIWRNAAFTIVHHVLRQRIQFHYRGVASLRQIRICVLKKLEGLSVKSKPIMCPITWRYPKRYTCSLQFSILFILRTFNRFGIIGGDSFLACYCVSIAI